MKFFHISDLHIGKRVNGFSMLEDQRYILQQIVELAAEHRPDGILIAGDLYDKSLPAAEAVELVDWFLSQFALLGIFVWAISGNHDSAERVAYGGRMMEQAGIYVARVFDGKLQGYLVTRRCDGQLAAERMEEEEMCGERADCGPQVCIWLLPYLRPSQARRFFPERAVETTQQAVEAVLAGTKLRRDCVNILVMHQFLAGASVCDSEELSVGGLDQIDASVVDAFDYVALGHLHRPQQVGRETVRYCGSPLKYSFSEAGHQKSVTVVEIEETHSVSVSTIPLVPRLDLREVRGPMERLLQKDVAEAANREDYLHVTLTDEEEILDAIGRLRDVYPNIMRLDFARRDAAGDAEEAEVLIEEKSPEELFAEFFFRQNGREMNERQRKLAEELLAEAGELRE